jgi:hypothetical protein
MKAKLNPLRSNRFLDRSSILSFNSASVFLSFTQDFILWFCEACLTPEFSRRESPASCAKFSMRGKLNPVGCNELIYRPSLEAFNPHSAFSSTRAAQLSCYVFAKRHIARINPRRACSAQFTPEEA